MRSKKLTALTLVMALLFGAYIGTVPQTPKAKAAKKVTMLGSIKAGQRKTFTHTGAGGPKSPYNSNKGAKLNLVALKVGGKGKYTITVKKKKCNGVVIFPTKDWSELYGEPIEGITGWDPQKSFYIRVTKDGIYEGFKTNHTYYLVLGGKKGDTFTIKVTRKKFK